MELEYLPTVLLELELHRYKNYPVGFFKNKEAMAIHQAMFHKIYWALEKAKAAAEQKAA